MCRQRNQPFSFHPVGLKSYSNTVGKQILPILVSVKIAPLRPGFPFPVVILVRHFPDKRGQKCSPRLVFLEVFLQALGRPEFPLDTWANVDPPTLVMSEATRRAIERSQPYRLKYDGVFVDVEILDDGESMALGETTVTNLEVPMAPDGDQRMSNFLFEGDAKLLVSPDETKYLNLYRVPSDLDCWIKECGMFKEAPDGSTMFTDSLWAEEKETEITFERTVEQVEEVRPERTILTELEEVYGRSYDDYLELEERYDRLGIAFGYDGMTVDL